MLYSFLVPDETHPIFGFYLMLPGADYPTPIRGAGGTHVIDCVLMQFAFSESALLEVFTNEPMNPKEPCMSYS